MLNDLNTTSIISETRIDGIPLSTITYIGELINLKIKQLNSYLYDLKKYQTELDSIIAGEFLDVKRIDELNKLIEETGIDYNNYDTYLKSRTATEDILMVVTSIKNDGPIKIDMPTGVDLPRQFLIGQTLDNGMNTGDQAEPDVSYIPSIRIDVIYTALINNILRLSYLNNDSRVNGKNPFQSAAVEAQ